MSENTPEFDAFQQARASLFRHNDLSDPVIQTLLMMELDTTDAHLEDE